MIETNDVESAIRQELRSHADSVMLNPKGWDEISARLDYHRPAGRFKIVLAAAAAALIIVGAALLPSAHRSTVASSVVPSCSALGVIHEQVSRPGMGFGATAIDLSTDRKWICLREGDKWWGVSASGILHVRGLTTITWDPPTSHRFTIAVLSPAVAKVVVSVGDQATIYGETVGSRIFKLANMRVLVAADIINGPVTVEAFTVSGASVGIYHSPEVTVGSGGVLLKSTQ